MPDDGDPMVPADWADVYDEEPPSLELHDVRDAEEA